jgi:conjugative transfer signal peptidase TraF
MRGWTALVLAVTAPFVIMFVRWNDSPSVPVGIYIRERHFHQGDIVEVCAPDRIAAEGLSKGYIPFGGPCYRGSRPLIKVLAAIGGDVVDVSPAGIAINGHRWPASRRRFATRDGHLITQWMRYGRTRLDPDHVLVLGTHPDSWDSRVWSDIPASCVRARWIPIPRLTFKGVES